MKALMSAIHELWGLFVEDPSFTLGILISLVAAGFVLPLIGIRPAWRGIGLFVLLALVLVENCRRSARG
jgi:hypothetical protein